jgi:hypothetical protein
MLAVLVCGCQNNSAGGTDIVTDAHGESVAPTYRIDIDPRWTKSTFAMADAVKKPCTENAGGGDWKACAIAHLVKALPHGEAMAPHCSGAGDFADQFYCITMGSIGSEIVGISGAGDPEQFIRDHGNAQADTAAAAAKILAASIVEKCGGASAQKGCISREAMARLGSSATSIKDCAGFQDEEKETSCLVIGRMSELLDQAAAGA